MQTSIERREGDTVELTITLPADVISREIGEAYSRVSSQLRIPGFRPGRAPRQIVDSRVGRDVVMQDALEHIVEDSYPRALDAERLRPIGSPDFGEMGPIAEGEEYSFSATVELRPELELSDDGTVSITVPSPKAADREIDVQVELVRERHANLEPVDRGIEEGDFVLLSFVGYVDGEEYEGSRVDHYLYEPGRAIMPAQFDEPLFGAKAGDTVRSEFVIPDTSTNAEFVGKTARFDIEVHEVKAKVLPDLDDAFAAEVGGHETLEELRDDIRRRIEEQKASTHQSEIEQAAKAALAMRLVGDVPEAMVEHRARSMADDFYQTLEQRQMTVEGYALLAGIEPDAIEGDIKERAAGVLREELALEALCRAKGIEASDEDLDADIAEMSGSEPGAAERMRERLRSAGMIAILREQILHRKALAWLSDNVEVTEAAEVVSPAAEDEDEPTASAAEDVPASEVADA